jgi:hypothetical protein
MDTESRRSIQGTEIAQQIFKTEQMAKTTGRYDEAKKFVESSCQSCIYFFWHGFEATIRGVDRTPDSSLEELLQPGNQPRVVTSTTGSTIQFTEYKVSQ